jgi:hypothetical protein
MFLCSLAPSTLHGSAEMRYDFQGTFFGGLRRVTLTTDRQGSASHVFQEW